jgi:hypothetical protein
MASTAEVVPQLPSHSPVESEEDGPVVAADEHMRFRLMSSSDPSNLRRFCCEVIQSVNIILDAKSQMTASIESGKLV